MPDRKYPAGLPLDVRGYVAGIIDGEGTISINRASFPRRPHLSVRYTAILSVGNTDYQGDGVAALTIRRQRCEPTSY